jgi:hypothetical protein
MNMERDPIAIYKWKPNMSETDQPYGDTVYQNSIATAVV